MPTLNPPALPRRPRRVELALAVTALALTAAVASLGWDLAAIADPTALAEAFDRLRRHLADLAAPDLSPAMLRRSLDLAAETLAIAVLGTALGCGLAYPLALGASHRVAVGDDPRGRAAALLPRAFREACRLGLDVLRAVPDFVWAVLLVTVTGVNAVTGVLALALGVGGLLGKVLSELWDNVDAARLDQLRSTGAGRLQAFAYGVQPLSARATLSFVLMRAECAVRNASVIGVVGGGGLGAALWDAHTDGDWSAVATLLLALLAVTASTDLAANVLRRRLRVDPNHPRLARPVDHLRARRRRRQVLCAVLVVIGSSCWRLAEPLGNVGAELARVDWGFVRGYAGELLRPDFGADALLAALREAAVPLAIGVIATAAGGLLAALLTYAGSVSFQLESHRFTGERAGPVQQIARGLLLVLSRTTALVLRGVPEVAWLIVLAIVFRAGTAPCTFAIALHTAGVLHRVFVEAIDDLPHGALTRSAAPTRAQTFVYAALPRAAATFRTYLFFQFEVNVRAGIALGLVGAGGLGHYFRANLDWRRHDVAATFLLTMVLLTVVIDRAARWLRLERRRC